MNLATIIALIILILLLIPAVRYLLKHGTCGSCPYHGGCSGHCETDKLMKRLSSDPEFKKSNEILEEVINRRKNQNAV